jgi:ABC-2 type transport system permease protein
MDAFISEQSGRPRLYQVTEVPLANTGEIDEFERWMPGMLALSVIMLMFSATIAIITEVDQKTILRFKLSAVKAWQFLVGVGGVQVLVGLLSLLLTFIAASSLGFENRGPVLLMGLICLLCILSMIAFSLLLAGLTRSVTEVLVVGNFPLFLFMFFTGAAFPIQVAPWFTLGGYGISWQTFMSPTPAIQALTKVSILGQGWGSVVPELITLMVVTIVYFLLGLLVFKQRHLRTP